MACLPVIMQISEFVFICFMKIPHLGKHNKQHVKIAIALKKQKNVVSIVQILKYKKNSRKLSSDKYQRKEKTRFKAVWFH